MSVKQKENNNDKLLNELLSTYLDEKWRVIH